MRDQCLAHGMQRKIAGHCNGMTFFEADVLCLGGASAVGIVAKLFLRIDGVVMVCGFACQRLRAETPRSQVWRVGDQLSLAPLDSVLARCTWAPKEGADILVLSSGL